MDDTIRRDGKEEKMRRESGSMVRDRTKVRIRR